MGIGFVAIRDYSLLSQIMSEEEIQNYLFLSRTIREHDSSFYSIDLFAYTGHTRSEQSLDDMLNHFQNHRKLANRAEQIIYDCHDWCIESLNGLDYKYELFTAKLPTTDKIFSVLKLTIINKEAAVLFRLLGP